MPTKKSKQIFIALCYIYILVRKSWWWSVLFFHSQLPFKLFLQRNTRCLATLNTNQLHGLLEWNSWNQPHQVTCFTNQSFVKHDGGVSLVVVDSWCMIKDEEDDDDLFLLLLFFLFLFLIKFTFLRLMRKGNNQIIANNQWSKQNLSCCSSNIRGIIVCGSCGDRTTATESKLSVRTVNIGASAFQKRPAIP